jgi:hypothetical protein
MVYRSIMFLNQVSVGYASSKEPLCWLIHVNHHHDGGSWLERDRSIELDATERKLRLRTAEQVDKTDQRLRRCIVGNILADHLTADGDALATP